MHHPAIVKFVGWAMGPKNKGHIYLKQAEKGSLNSIIKKSQDGKPDPLWDDTHKFIISYGIAVAMKYLHSHKTIHRDLKCENILLDSDLQPYITDFGTSKVVDDIKTSQTVTQTSAQIMPPEFLEDYELHNREPSIDVYSYSMILYCIWTEQEIFKGLSPLQMVEKIQKGKRPEFPSADVPLPNWRRLIESCWQQNPKDRPTFQEICRFLSSSEFVNSSIDVSLFKSYQKSIGEPDDSFDDISTIDLLKKKADEGNPDSQLAYALRLFNGLEVDKNVEESKRYFEMAADNGNAESQCYLSLILAREGDAEKSIEYLQKSINSGYSEAYSNYAQQLVSSGNIDGSLSYLQYAISRGSMSASITYGNICEANGQYGCEDIFYKVASNCCHCLDSVGLYFPIEFKVFKCNDCGIETCEACAKSCHRGHSVVEIGSSKAFVCECGKNHFLDRKNKNHCSVEFVGEMMCGDEPVCYQHFFRCLDCSSDPNMLICKGCALNCHKEHKVIDCGVKRGACACGTKKLSQKCKNCYFVDLNEKQCSRSTGNYPLLQRWFQCLTCGLYGNEEQGVCSSCARTCHNGHALIDRGVRKNKCQCVDTNQCQFKK